LEGGGLKAKLMGKAADNEFTKLRATWFNNISVGLVLGGIFIPTLAFVQSGPSTFFRDWLTGNFHLPDELQVYKFTAVILAFVIARVCARAASKEISNIQD
jgi:hypothetical protein